MATTLTTSQKAPLFTGTDQNGNKIALKDYRGKKLVLFFYPADNTPACTTEACNLRDNYLLLQQNGLEVLGVSPDDEKSHQNFIEKHRLPFTLIADKNVAIAQKYGVWSLKQLYGREYIGLHRTTFIIDEKGTIIKIFIRPKNKAHAEEIIDWLKETTK